MKNKRIILIMLILLLVLSVGCKGGNIEKDGDKTGEKLDLNLGQNKEEDEENILGEDEEDILGEDDRYPSFVEDYNGGMVRIDVVNGNPSISFDIDKWIEINHIDRISDYNSPLEDLREGPFPIAVSSGKVVKAIVDDITKVKFNNYDYNTPIVLFLMDDGGIEYFEADINMSIDFSEVGYEHIEKYYSHRLGSKNDYIDFYPDIDEEGYGDTTFFIKDKYGFTSDFYHLLIEAILHEGTWVTHLGGGYSTKIIMGLNEENEMFFITGDGDRYDASIYQSYEEWVGVYKYISARGEDYPPGTLVYDLYQTYTIAECPDGDCEPWKIEINGSYRVDFNDEGLLVLYHNEGDDLFQVNTNNKVFTFSNYFEEEEDPYRKPGEYLALLKYGGTTNDGSTKVLLKYVDWIEDSDEPNDYRIEEYGDWEEYILSDIAEIYIWYFIDDEEYYGMRQDRLQNPYFGNYLEYTVGEDGMLANVNLAYNRLLYVREVYIP